MITYNEVPQGSLGGVNTSKDLNGELLGIAAPGVRSISGGQTFTNLAAGFSYGTLAGTLDPITGIWTCPVTGYYDLTLLFSLSADVSPFNNLTSGINPNGFMGPYVNPAAAPVDFNEYNGEIIAALTDLGAGIVFCCNSQLCYINTSHVLISAGYNGRRITAGTQIRQRALNKCRNEMTGNAGNSFHFSITHVK